MNTYQIRESILEQGERSLYHALSLIIAQRALVLTKVKLSAIFTPTSLTGSQLSNTFLDRFTADFVICDRQTTKPLLIIQQEQETPSCRSVITRASLNEAMGRLAQTCGLPFLVLPSESAYRMDRLLRLIEPYLLDDKRGSDYAVGDRDVCATGTTVRTQSADRHTPPIPRPATLFSAN